MSTRQTKTAPFVTKETYQSFLSVMLGIALTLWVTGLFLALQGEAGNIIIWPINIDLAVWFIYGIVIICFYWIFAEIIMTSHLPTNIFSLLLDFLILSGFAGAAYCVVRKGNYFPYIAFVALLLLTSRFIQCAINEGKNGEKLKSNYPFWYVCVFVFTFFACVLFFAGALYRSPSLDEYTDSIMSGSIFLGMFVGVVITFIVSGKHRNEQPSTLLLKVHECAQSSISPVLIPNYQRVGDIKEISASVFEGEAQYRKLLTKCGLCPPFQYHLSTVHSYRDVETQAFIMATAGKSTVEREHRAMWVYLTHWFDDIFDDLCAARVRNLPNVSELMAEENKNNNIDFLLATMPYGERFLGLWNNAFGKTVNAGFFNVSDEEKKLRMDLFKSGFRRMLLSGLLFSPNAQQSEDCCMLHRNFLLGKVSGESFKLFFGNIDPKYLAYTTKVVVELWDSLGMHPNWDVSLTMDCFYAVGLYLHDWEKEIEQEGAPLGMKIHDAELKSTVETTIELILHNKGLFAEALKPVPVYLDCFRSILEKHNCYKTMEMVLK